MLRHTADQAASLAARDAIVPVADINLIEAAAENHLATIGVVNATVAVSPGDIKENTKEVEVTVTIPATANSLVVPRFVFGDLIGRTRLMTERFPMEMSTNLPEPENHVHINRLAKRCAKVSFSFRSSPNPNDS